jgi:hypothetical protein
MLVLKRVVENPLSLRSWFPPDLRVGTLFLPNLVDIPVGQEICLWLVIPGLHVDLYLLGTVLFRRLKAMRGNPGMAAGSGLALRPGHVTELNFLQRLLTHGTGPIAMRRFTRTPLLVPWEAKVVVPHLSMWSPATLTEISLGGARIVLDMMPVHEGALMKVELPWHSGAVHELELAWFRMSEEKVCAGLSRPLGSPLGERDWEELVARAMEYFRGRVRET